MPWITAPQIWFSIVLRLTGRPTFCRATNRFTFTTPVSVSTITSAKCTASLCGGLLEEAAIFIGTEREVIVGHQLAGLFPLDRLAVAGDDAVFELESLGVWQAPFLGHQLQHAVARHLGREERLGRRRPAGHRAAAAPAPAAGRRGRLFTTSRSRGKPRCVRTTSPIIVR